MPRMRGIVGIEAAIVLIAFVLVASALAFVAINMGMFASQKSKEVMAKAYEASTRALDVAGSAIAKVDTASEQVVMVYVPVKLAAGASPIDLNKTVVSVLIQKPNETGVAIADAVSDASVVRITMLDEIILDSYNASWFATSKSDTDRLLEQGEILILAINVTNSTGAGLPAYSTVEIEIKPPIGAPLLVRYEVPPILTSDYIDLIIGG
ncbi:MAG TPA: flagellin [Pyrodictium delaneyi]|uniref:Flagellin n=1 Tax=Pyrodictium delaneyi TaxID=1273541 RepID=A0A833EAP0_9CREN|nr:flagellin [Pyrodictium delaneyi]